MEINLKLSPDNVRIGRILIFGTGESGKTWLAAAIAPMLGPKENMYVCGPVRAIAERIGGVKWYDVPTDDREAQERFFAHVLAQSRIPYAEGGHDPILIVDEADLYYTSAGRSYGSHSFKKIVNIARNFGMCQMFIARGMTDLASNTIGNANLVLFGRVNSPPILDYIRKYMRDVPDAERLITNLPPHVFLAYAPNETPKLKGLVWLNTETGQIETRDLTQRPGETSPEESTNDNGSPESPSSGDNASTPAAAESSRIALSPTSAPSTTPSGSGSRIVGGKPGGEPGKPA